MGLVEYGRVPLKLVYEGCQGKMTSLPCGGTAFGKETSQTAE
jgi:hypothetical protein